LPSAALAIFDQAFRLKVPKRCEGMGAYMSSRKFLGNFRNALSARPPSPALRRCVGRAPRQRMRPACPPIRRGARRGRRCPYACRCRACEPRSDVRRRHPKLGALHFFVRCPAGLPIPATPAGRHRGTA
jgi:hypothetical protein